MTGTFHLRVYRARRIGRPLLGVLFWLLLVTAGLQAQSLEDLFANRQSTSSPSDSVRGNNARATIEPFEPKHGGKPGGHSLWLEWTATSTGIATFSTEGSSFDTLLSAYILDPNNPNKPPLDRLKEVARSDDFEKSKTSLIQFGAVAGTTYQIAIDGYSGATGDIRLRWDLIRSDAPLPIIVQLPVDRSMRSGDPLVLTVDVQAGDGTNLHWFFNDTEIQGVNGNTLTIPSFQRANVGRYRLRVTSGKVRFFSEPIEVQINSEGEVTTLARDKLFDASNSGLVGRDSGGDDKGGGAFGAPSRLSRGGAKPAGPIGDTLGFNGTQIFSTLYAQTDPTEPAHCGVAGGASYWLSYTPPADGPLTLDTIGSDFPTVLAVYTYQDPLVGYESLQSVGCDLKSGPGGTSSRLQVQVQSGKRYFIVVDGLQGGRGIAHINYSLPKPVQSVAPKLISVPPLPPTRLGSALVWTIQASGTPPLTYLWRRGDELLTTTTNGEFQIANVTSNNAGLYSVEVTNSVGGVRSDPVELRVLAPPHIAAFTGPRVARLGEPTTFEVQFQSTAPTSVAWYKDATLLAGETNATLHIPALKLTDAGTYLVRITDTGGVTQSEPIELSVSQPPRVEVSPESQVLPSGTNLVLRVIATGTQPLQYQWFHDGTAVESATNSLLEFVRVQTANSGRYWAEVRNDAGVTLSAEAVLQVLDPPEVTQPLPSQIVGVGEWVQWDLEYTGSEPIEIQWRHNGQVLAGETARQLRFQALSPAQAGAYSVTIRNPIQSSPARSTTLAILFPAAIRLDADTREIVLTQPALEGAHYVLETLDGVEGSTWIELLNGNATANGVEVRQATSDATRFYRFRFTLPTP